MSRTYEEDVRVGPRLVGSGMIFQLGMMFITASDCITPEWYWWALAAPCWLMSGLGLLSLLIGVRPKKKE